MSDPTKIDGRPAATTQMTAPPPAGQRMVKIVAKRECQHHRDGVAMILKKGDKLEVTEAEANELCRKLEGTFSFYSGERAADEASKHDMTLAERVA